MLAGHGEGGSYNTYARWVPGGGSRRGGQTGAGRQNSPEHLGRQSCFAHPAAFLEWLKVSDSALSAPAMTTHMPPVSQHLSNATPFKVGTYVLVTT